MGSHTQPFHTSTMSAPVMTKEVTSGTFDPRTYKQVDKAGWAKKRKPEWMATTGQIHFTRERTVASQERDEPKVEGEEVEVERKVEAPVVVEVKEEDVEEEVVEEEDVEEEEERHHHL